MKQYKALYRENRPEVFSEIIGQEHIVKVLKNQIATDSVSHAYLFCGTRGTGKTTTARILAKGLNCDSEKGEKPCGICKNCRDISSGTFVDVIEIDAASNNGVESIRELRESVNFPPAIGKKKVYIIDEVHMLSTGAFNALLKTLEEPPDNVVFILATTDPEKLPQTILSRCMRMDFRRVSGEKLRENMRIICQNKGIKITDEALALLSANADGSVRDSLSLLEQCLSSGEDILDRDTILDFMGAVSVEFYLSLTDNVINGNIAEALISVEKALKDGKDVKQMMKDWMSHYRNLLICKFVKDPENMLNISLDNIEKIKEQSNIIDVNEINRSIITLAKTINDARYSTQSRILMESSIVILSEGMEYGTSRKEIIEPTISAKKIKPKVLEKVISSEESQKENNDKNSFEIKGSEIPQKNMQNIDFKNQEYMEEVWDFVCEEAAKIKGSLSILRNASIKGMNDEEFKIIVDRDFYKNQIMREEELICTIMENKTGVHRNMVIKNQELSNKEKEEEKLRNAKKEAENVLGRKVDLR